MQSSCTSINSIFENILISMLQNGFLIEQEIEFHLRDIQAFLFRMNVQIVKSGTLS